MHKNLTMKQKNFHLNRWRPLPGKVRQPILGDALRGDPRDGSAVLGPRGWPENLIFRRHCVWRSSNMNAPIKNTQTTGKNVSWVYIMPPQKNVLSEAVPHTRNIVWYCLRWILGKILQKWNASEKQPFGNPFPEINRNTRWKKYATFLHTIRSWKSTNGFKKRRHLGNCEKERRKKVNQIPDCKNFANFETSVAGWGLLGPSGSTR